MSKFKEMTHQELCDRLEGLTSRLSYVTKMATAAGVVLDFPEGENGKDYHLASDILDNPTDLDDTGAATRNWLKGRIVDA